jgi:hypothetical protein
VAAARVEKRGRDAGLDKGEDKKKWRSSGGEPAFSPHGNGGGPATLQALYPAARPWSPRAYGRPLHSPPNSKMRHEKTFLPLVGK